ncbi:MAG: CehA/McbA family metallohydrolase [Candidatus Schekmanbacteria bacterium]|nr:CehA/McbA family metallohydrolase [Candidatus Schekmanbacteria bacterium]
MDEPRLFWGDLHGHSRWSREAVGDPPSYYWYARDEAKLDFSALTDHDFSITPKRWEKIQELAGRFYEPGRFTSFVAYEWTATKYGHKVVLFADDAVPERIFKHSQRESDTPPKLWRCLEPFSALTIPHHPLATGIVTDWNFRNDRMQPFVEVYSKHGSSEHRGSEPRLRAPSRSRLASVQAALALGHRLGMVCGTDTHCAKPGSPERTELFTHRLILRHHGGIMAAYARELSRDALWEAFTSRYVYGTTGARTVLHFAANGRPMGTEFSSESPPRLCVTVRAERPAWESLDSPSPLVQQVELLRNNEVIRVFEPRENTFSFEEEDRQIELGLTFYYVRVTQSDGHRAWSSPVWVNYQP